MHVAKFLSQKKQRKSVGSVHIVHELDGDFRKVALLLTPSHEDQSDVKQSSKKRKTEEKVSETKITKKKKKTQIKFRVRLVFGTQLHDDSSVNGGTGWISNARLFPDRCNNKVMNVPEKQANSEGTQMYNNSLASDLHHISTTNILASVSNHALKAYTEVWTLLKIWCLQRGFLRGHDTFSDTTLGLSLAYLYRTKMVSVRMDSIQVFTVWMKFMVDIDWLGEKDKTTSKNVVNEDKIQFSSSIGYQDINISGVRGNKHREGIVMPSEGMSEKQTIAQCIQNRLYCTEYAHQADDSKPSSLLECFKAYTDAPVFLDPSMTFNYFGNVCASFIREVQEEAAKALECIHFHRDANATVSSNHRVDPFRQLFLEHARFWRRHDAYISIDLRDIDFCKDTARNVNTNFWGGDIQDVGARNSILQGLLKVLNMALGDRVSALRILTSGNGEVSSTDSTHSQLDNIGTKIFLESDQIKMIPVRHTSDSSFSGIPLHHLLAPVSIDENDNHYVTIGMRINRDACHRIVDRGPPADETEASGNFVALWGKAKAQLRRFKDGAIVHAVVWNDFEGEVDETSTYENGEKMGDTVERVVRHIIRTHFLRDTDSAKNSLFKLRNLLSLVEGTTQRHNSSGIKFMNNAEYAHKSMMNAFESLSKFLRSNSQMETVGHDESASKLGLPLSIDAVEALSPSLRYSSTFPQTPHSLLGAEEKSSQKKISGAVSNESILIQIRFEGSSKWPTDTNAMGAAKCAMLTQIADGIEKMKHRGDPESSYFEGSMNVAPSYLEFGYRGYVWRVVIRADQELKMLANLRNPSAEAIALRQVLRKNHVINSQHHFTIHGVTSKHPCAGYVIRLMARWLASHMLSGLIPHEAIELLVTSVFTDPSPLNTPGTASSAFLRTLHLLANHNWSKSPLIVDPEGHITVEDRMDIVTQFESVRGVNFQNGPPMYVISPNDRPEEDGIWKPSYTQHFPERVVLSRVSVLANRSYHFLLNGMSKNTSIDDAAWMSIFQESGNSLKSYSALFRVNPYFIMDITSKSTQCDLSLLKDNDGNILTPYRRSIQMISMGPKELRKKNYKNLIGKESILYAWHPVDDVVSSLRSKYGKYAVFFYNQFCPEIIAMLWRPTAFNRQAFSAMHAEFMTPIEFNWATDSLVTTNANDLLRAVKCILHDVVVDVKILDDRSIHQDSGSSKKGSKRKQPEENETSSSDEDDSDR
jgi:U3 small nucleolar RNA-associated protein 22